jgi:hypothetical protein
MPTTMPTTAITTTIISRPFLVPLLHDHGKKEDKGTIYTFVHCQWVLGSPKQLATSLHLDPMMFNAIQNPTKNVVKSKSNDVQCNSKSHKKCDKIKFTSSSSITSRNDLSSTLWASKWVCSRS